MVVSSSSYKVKAIGFIVLSVALIIQILTGPALKPTSFEPLLLAVLLLLSIYFSFFIDVELNNEREIELSSLWKRKINYHRIIQFDLTPIYSRQQGRTSGIYKIKYTDTKNTVRTRLVSIPEGHFNYVDDIKRIISK